MPAWLGFAKPLSANSGIDHEQSAVENTVQRIDLQATSRKAVAASRRIREFLPTGSSAEVQAVHEAGIGMDVTPKVFQNRTSR